MTGRQIQKGCATGALVLGVMEIVCGLIIIILSVLISGKAVVSASLSPYWAGIVFTIPGIIGVVAGCTKNHCAMVAFMVMNILAFIIQGVAAVLVGLIITVWASIVANVTKNCQKIRSGTCICHNNSGSFTLSGIKDDCDVVNTIVNMAFAVVALLAIAAIITLVSSILGCIAVCCTQGPAQPGTIIIQQQGPGVPLQNQPAKY